MTRFASVTVKIYHDVFVALPSRLFVVEALYVCQRGSLCLNGVFIV